ncbi:HSP20-like chaperones superfamily protein [Striga asiatica]|uniref:HSP20-like chaperones superfamily protein n=1 Tax=Striga asiatica TaxID=4170 RepID=A0A5A7P7F7_STRAF|nr:HSP20-like chaperones superfamily protein [Striga asiatica]
MGDGLLTALSIENHHHPSTLLSMDSSASSSHDELDLEMTHHIILTRPPDINLPLSSPPPPHLWAHPPPDILDVGLGPAQLYGPDTFLVLPTKPGKKCGKRVDTIWGAWFFFSFYFKPVLNEKSKAKIVRDGNGLSGFEKSDLQLDNFMVQHDMENMYMWAFKEKPENALGKMQLRSYMNGHSRQGERPFPFSAEKGFVRSHRMQRKHYRGLSNPQCVHGVELSPSPSLTNLDEDDRRRWVELTGRDINFTVPPEASGYGSWRNIMSNNADFEHNHNNSLCQAKKDRSPEGNKRKKDSVSDEDCFLGGVIVNGHHDPETPRWLAQSSGVMRSACGPVTAGKTTYEDEKGYLILVSLPFVDRGRVRVSWRNTISNGIIKICCTSTSRAPVIKRQNRTFRLADRDSEHCPPGEFVREIQLPTRIPENGEIEAYFDGQGTVLEILRIFQ